MNDPAKNDEGGGGTRLALEFCSDAFLLHQRDGGSWRAAASAPLEPPISAPDFDAAISRIAEAARGIAGVETPEVELWLPPERVLIARLKPGETPDDALAAAPAPAEELIHDLSRAGDVVVITEYSVVEDALRYARRWGFAPTRVTARVALRAFPEGPDFAETAAPAPAPVLLPAVAPLRRLSPGLASGLALAGAGLFAAFAIFVAPVFFADDAPPRLEAPAALSLNSPLDAGIAIPAPADPPRLAATLRHASAPPAGGPKPGAGAPAAPPRVTAVAPLPAPATGDAPRRPTRLAALAAAGAAAAPPGAPARPASGPRIEASPESPPAEAAAAPDAEAPEATVTAPAVVASVEDPAVDIEAADPPILTADETPVVPADAPPIPAPRPGSAAPDPAGAAPPPAETHVEALVDADADAAPESPEEADAPPGPGAVARAPTPKSRPDALDMSPSDRIATLSPSPSPRPKSIKKHVAPVAVEIGTKGVREVRAPKRPAPKGPGVANAATLKDAIRLEEMNLLGVFGSDGARRALLRLADGQVLRVSRGAVVDGWVVSRIDATSMRITRNGEARVLDLAQ